MICDFSEMAMSTKVAPGVMANVAVSVRGPIAIVEALAVDQIPCIDRSVLVNRNRSGIVGRSYHIDDGRFLDNWV